MGEWKAYRLGDLGVFSGGVTSIKPDDYGFGTPFIPYTNVYRNSRVDVGQLQLMNVTKNDLVRKNCIYGDIFFTAASETDDEVAMSSVLLDNVENLTFNGFCKRYRLNDFMTLLPEYARYYFRSPAFRKEVFQRVNGDIRYNISQASLKEIPIIIPAVDEQRAIASVLSSLDAKIDLLHRQNKTLEAMAEALFRQWFVEKAEEGWEEYVLTDIATHCKDSVNPGQHPTRLYHHYSLPAYDEGRKPSPELGDTIKSSKYVVPENAVLISKLNPRFPRVWPVRDKKHEHPISSTEFQVFVPKKDESFGFLYCFLSSKAVQDELASAASGTSGSHQRVSPDDIKGLTFQAKSKQQLKDFSKVVDPLLEKVETNKDQVANLTKLRDTLLPKLMSGEVRVEGVVKSIEEAKE